MKQMFHISGGVSLAVYQDGEGNPFIFQHGLCGDQAQPAQVFPSGAGYFRMTVECRGHGHSEAGPIPAFSIATFSNDIASAITAAGIQRAVVGGISMGAACALHLAVKRPELLRALVIARPAWITDRGPENMSPNLLAGDLLARFAPDEARRQFDLSETSARLAQDAPDNLNSVRGFFAREPIDVTSALLRAISSDGPGVTEAEIRALTISTLVIGNSRDFIHPLGYARTLASWIPGATFVEVTSKADNPQAYQSDFREALATFLKEI